MTNRAIVLALATYRPDENQFERPIVIAVVLVTSVFGILAIQLLSTEVFLDGLRSTGRAPRENLRPRYTTTGRFSRRG